MGLRNEKRKDDDMIIMNFFGYFSIFFVEILRVVYTLLTDTQKPLRIRILSHKTMWQSWKEQM